MLFRTLKGLQPGAERPGWHGVRARLAYGRATLTMAPEEAVLSDPQRSQPCEPPPLQRELECGAVGSAHATASAARATPMMAMYRLVLRT